MGQFLSFFCIDKNANRENCKGRRHKAAIAVGKKPLTTKGSGERRKLPQRDLGQSPRNRSDFERFMPKWSAFWDDVNIIFKKKLNRKNSR